MLERLDAQREQIVKIAETWRMLAEERRQKLVRLGRRRGTITSCIGARRRRQPGQEMTQDNKAAEYRQQAAKMRAERDTTRDAIARQLLLEMAESYDRLADWAERQQKVGG